MISLLFLQDKDFSALVSPLPPQKKIILKFEICLEHECIAYQKNLNHDRMLRILIKNKYADTAMGEK